MKIPKILGVLIALSFLVSSVTYGGTIKVPDNYITIQEAIDAAIDGDIILVASGAYAGPIYFNGKKIEVRSVSGPNVTVIDGGVQFHGNETKESILEGFNTIGSVDIIASSPTIKNCKLKGEGTASDGGHGSISMSSSPTFIGCNIYDGHAGFGGGYNVQDSSATFIDCVFFENEASADGGALYIVDSTVKIENCNFERNTAGDSGGGVYITGSSSSEIVNTNFKENNSQIYGGAIDCHHNVGDIQISKCSFSKNKTVRWGGALATEYVSSLTVESCIFSDNGPCWYGGAVIDSWGASITVNNSIFTKNMAGNGGGIFVLPGNDTEIINCTFFQNNGHDRGGAVNGCSPLKVSNSILWDNFSLDGQEHFCGDPNLQHIMIVFYSDIDQDGFAGNNGNIRQDPLFVDPENGDIHLQPSSPCIDRGTSAGAPNYDFEGDIRPQGAGYDIGADESPFSVIEPIQRIQAEDYDQGGQRIAYFDKTPGNAGGQYRQDDVDIWRSGPDNCYTGANAKGEWLNYTVDVPHSGEYRLDLRVATPNSNRRVHVEFDGVDKTGPLTVANTGWWTYWETLSANVTLSAGRQVMRLVIDNGGLNIDQMALVSCADLSSVAVPTIKPNGGSFTDSVKVTLITATANATIYYTTDGSDPFSSATRKAYGAPFTLTGDTTVRAYAVKAGMNDSDEAIADFIREAAEMGQIMVQAEDYNLGGQGVAYFDKTPGNTGGQYRQDDVDIWRSGPNTYYTGANATGEWLNYTIDVPYHGEYRLDIRLATPYSNRRVHVEFDGVDQTGPLTAPNTGWWASWQTLSTMVTLNAGQQVMRLVVDYGGMNIDQISLVYIGN